jgi:signal transduction histidine kinase/ActR/RegA family two-component response regulator
MTSASANLPESVDERLFRVQVDTLYASYRRASVSSFLAALGYVLYYYWHTGDANIWWWLALRATGTISAFKIMVVPRVTLQDRQRWLRTYLRSVTYHGFVWGLVPWLFLSRQDFLLNLLTVIMLSLLCTAGLSSVVANRRATQLLILPTMLSLTAALLWHAQDGQNFFLALCTMLYLLLMFRNGDQHHRLLIESLRARFENETLTAQLAEQVRAVQLASDEKTRFLAAASHDLRQPLHATTLFAAVLSRSSNLDNHDHALAQRISESLTGLSTALNGMLDLSRLDAGVVIPDVRPVNLQQSLIALHHTYAVAAEEKGLELRIRSSGPLWVLSDAPLLERLLGNLIDNAIKHTAKGGVLVLARPGARRPDGGPAPTRIEVVDTGPGIDPADHDRVFDEFYQLNNPQRDRNQGLGLGLSIVKRLAVLLGHTLTLRSRLGRGCRLTLSLTPAEAPLAAAAPAQEAGADGWALPRHVLILDDDKAGVDALSGLLESYGVQVSAAHDVPQAQALLRGNAERGAQDPVDAVISDFRLPGAQSGLDFLLDLRRTRPGLPALMITGETAPERVAVIQQHGLSCLFKPVRTAELLEHLARLARERRAGAPLPSA